MNTASRTAFGLKVLTVLGLLALSSGCIVVPVPEPGETHVVYIEKSHKKRIQVGESTQNDVLDVLGSPTSIAVNPSIWMYSVNEYLSTGWELCVAFFIYGGFDGGCPGDFPGEERYSFMEIRFNDDRVVSQRRIQSLAAGECTATGFCWDGRPAFRAVRGVRKGPVWHCAVHLFTPNQEILAELDVGGAKQFDLALTRDDFQILLLQSWEPEFTLSFVDGSTRRVAVPCARNAANFLVVFEEAATYHVSWVPEDRGRLAVMNKQTLTRVNFN